MKFKTLFVAAFAALSLIATGCGGGGNSTEEDETITRTLLAGSGNSTTQTSKKWRTVFLRGNSHYSGTGADQPCPVELNSVDGEDSIDCDPSNSLELRSDGKGRYVREDVSEAGFDSEWTLNGDTMILVDRTEDLTGNFTITFKLTNEGIVAGRRRIRMTTLSSTEADGTTARPGDVGFQLVIEEV